MRKTNLIKILLAAAPVLVAGCGGSSGVSAGYPSSPASAGNPIGPGFDGGSTMQTLTSGLSWRFAVSGTITRDYLDNQNNKQSVSGKVANGVLTRVLTDTVVNGAVGLEVTDTFSYQLQGMPPTVEISRRYIQQQGDNSIAELGANAYGTDFSTSTISSYLPGTFSTAGNLSANLTLASYSLPQTGYGTDLIAFTALGQESVPSTTSVPYKAWKTQSTSTEHWVIDGSSDINNGVPLAPGFVLISDQNRTSVDDWVPAIGVSVRSHVTVAQRDQVVISYTVTTDPTTKLQTITYVEQTLNKSESLDLALIARS